MEAEYRAQIIILKKALAEKKEVIRRLNDNPVLEFLGNLQTALDFAHNPVCKVLQILNQLLNAFQKDLHQEISSIGQEYLSEEVLHILIYKFKMVHVLIFNTDQNTFNLISKFLIILNAMRKCLTTKSVSYVALDKKYLLLIGYLIMDIKTSTNLPTVKGLAFGQKSTTGKDFKEYSVLDALIKPELGSRNNLSLFDIAIQTNEDVPSRLSFSQLEEVQTQTTIRLHQYSSTIQELRSKLKFE